MALPIGPRGALARARTSSSTRESGHYAALPQNDVEMRSSHQRGSSGETREISVELAFPSSHTRDELMIHAEKQGSFFSFVQSGWFQGFTAVVLISNIISMAVEAGSSEQERNLFVLDQLVLLFFVCELACRLCYFGSDFVCGPRRLVAWNMLDVAVVTAGIIQQWLVPSLPIDSNHSIHFLSALRVLRMLRFVRFLRVLKIIRVIMDTDLSFAEGPMFNSFIGVVITTNALIMGLETDMLWGGWVVIEQVLLSIYVFELFVRIKRFGWYYLEFFNPDFSWNLLDLMIVVSSVTDTWLMPLLATAASSVARKDSSRSSKHPVASMGPVMMFIRTLRLMRILRLVRLVKSFRPLYILVNGVLAALQGIFWVLVLTATVLYAMGIMATRLIGHGMIFKDNTPPSNILEPFKTVPDSMFTLFRVMSGASSADDSTAIDALMKEVPMVKMFFVYFLVTSSWTLLSILTAVVSENMITTTGQEEEALRIASAEDDRQRAIQQVKELFHTLDVDRLEEESLDSFLANRSNAHSTARFCKMSVHDVRDVLRTLRSYGHDVSLGQFADKLVDAKNFATERSLMKIEARLSAMQLRTEALLESLSDRLGACQPPEKVSGESQAAISERVMVMLDHLYTKEQRTSKGIDSLRESVRGLQDTVGRQPGSGEGQHSSQSARATSSGPAPDQIAELLERLGTQTQRSGDALRASVSDLHEVVTSLRSEVLRENASRRRDEASVSTLAAQLEASLAALHASGSKAIHCMHHEANKDSEVRGASLRSQAASGGAGGCVC